MKTNLSDLPLVTQALQALAPGVKIEPKVTETCCQCGRVRQRGDWKWEWLQVIPLNFKPGVGLKPLCPVCSERINAQHEADQVEEDWPE